MAEIESSRDLRLGDERATPRVRRLSKRTPTEPKCARLIGRWCFGAQPAYEGAVLSARGNARARGRGGGRDIARWVLLGRACGVVLSSIPSISHTLRQQRCQTQCTAASKEEGLSGGANHYYTWFLTYRNPEQNHEHTSRRVKASRAIFRLELSIIDHYCLLPLLRTRLPSAP